MNRPIRVLAVFCGVLFLALLLNSTYVQFVDAEDLNDDAGNRRVLDEQFSRKRGPILVAGEPVARSMKTDDEFDYQRVYRETELYAHLTGYYSYVQGSSDVELSANEILAGSDPILFVNRVVDLIGNEQPRGGSVQLSIDPAAQQAALDGLDALAGDPSGAVVALEPDTGAVLAMVASPSYDPNLLASHDLSEASRAAKELARASSEPLLDRTRENSYFPGSTFKLVTAAAALESGKYTPETLVPGGPTLDLPDSPQVLTNDVEACGSADITLTQALALSCNVSFGSVGLDLGNEVLQDQAEAFGFNDEQTNYLDGLRVVRSTYPSEAPGPFAAYNAIGQFEVSATPLQMAMVAAGIANDGTVMAPYVIDEVRSPDLEVVESADPEELNEAVSSEVADQLTDMMVSVVDDGTAGEAAIEGVEVAAKTGTAERSEQLAPYAWFVSFAPADDPQVAVAVFIEDAAVARELISGGGLAGPIARQVMEAVIEQ